MKILYGRAILFSHHRRGQRVIMALRVMIKLLGLLVLCWPVFTFARVNHKKTKLLTLKETVLLAMRNNPQIVSAEMNRTLQKFSVEIARNQFEPQFSIGANASIGSGDHHVSGIVSPGVKLNTTYGTAISLSPTQNYQNGQGSSAVTLSVDQPLLRGRGEVAKFPLLDALDQEKINKLQYRETVMSQITAVMGAYYQIVENSNQLIIVHQSLAEAMRELKQQRVQYRLGKLPGADLYTQRSTITEQQLALSNAENDLLLSKQHLVALLGLKPGSDFVVNTKIAFKSYFPGSQQSVINKALMNDASYQSQVIGMAGLKRAVISADNDADWQLDMHAETNLAERGYNQQSHNPNSSVGLNLTIPINDLATKQQKMSAQIGLTQGDRDLEQARRDLRSQIIAALYNLRTQKVNIGLGEEDVRLGVINLRNEKLKLNYGRSDPVNVANLTDALITKKVSLVASKIAYLQSVAQLQQSLGETLAIWHVQLRNY